MEVLEGHSFKAVVVMVPEEPLMAVAEAAILEIGGQAAVAAVGLAGEEAKMLTALMAMVGVVDQAT